MSTPKEPRQFTVREFHWRDGDITFDIVPDDYEGGEPHKKFIVREVHPPVQREEWIYLKAAAYADKDYPAYQKIVRESFEAGARAAFAVADAEKNELEANLKTAHDMRIKAQTQLASRDKTISELVEALEKQLKITLDDFTCASNFQYEVHQLARQALQKAKAK